MYADYKRLGSLRAAARLHGRSSMSLWSIFVRRDLIVQPKNLKPKRSHNGRSYTKDRNGYWRDTVYRGTRGRDGVQNLHHVIWIETHGPIPPGHRLIFKDGNKDNCKLSNLELLTNSEQSRRHATGHNQFTRSAAERTQTLLQNFNCGRRTLTAQLNRKS